MLQLASSSPARPARPTRLRVVTGRDLAYHRLTMGLTIAAVAIAMRVHHYRLRSLEAGDMPLRSELRERWEAALRIVATKRLRLLARQGWPLDSLPEPMRAAFTRYVR